MLPFFILNIIRFEFILGNIILPFYQRRIWNHIQGWHLNKIKILSWLLLILNFKLFNSGGENIFKHVFEERTTAEMRKQFVNGFI